MNTHLLQQNFFTIFGIEANFDLPLAQLEQTYRRLQNELHPDRFIRHSDAEKRLALQAAVRVNEAWQTLKNPVSRARYLLQLHGIDTAEEQNTSMPTEFLMAQIQWREAIEAAQSSQNAQTLEKIAADLAAEHQESVQQIAQAFAQQNWEQAALAVRQCRFFERLEANVGDALESLLF